MLDFGLAKTRVGERPDADLTPAERTTRTLEAARRDLGVIRARFEKAFS